MEKYMRRQYKRVCIIFENPFDISAQSPVVSTPFINGNKHSMNVWRLIEC